MRYAMVGTLVGLSVGSLTYAVVAQESKKPIDNGYINLQVLPQDISREELGQIMVQNLQGLGLPRLGGKGCLFCHEGDMSVPRDEWDFASDAKPTKGKARAMMEMTKVINKVHLKKLHNRIDRSFKVSCMTCHLGRTDPRPLPDRLINTYEEGGVEALTQQFEELREKYLGSQAYDFRSGSLTDVAVTLVGQNKMSDAIAVAQLNVDTLPEDQSAWVTLLLLEMDTRVDAGGIEAAIAYMDSMESQAAAGSVGPSLLNSLAWRLIRSERAELGFEVIEANFERNPGVYVPLESKVFMLRQRDKTEDAIALLEGWLAEHPDHDRAKNLLVNLRRKR
jgi:photosynthetic reaction center cytochrome c subunit